MQIVAALAQRGVELVPEGEKTRRRRTLGAAEGQASWGEVEVAGPVGLAVLQPELSFSSGLGPFRLVASSATPLRMPRASRITTAWSDFGRQCNRNMPSASPTCVTMQNDERRAFVEVQWRAKR
jgi:hypothetical protein